MKQNSYQTKNLNADEEFIKWTPYVDPTIPIPIQQTNNHHHHHHHV
jgi:hypothetical protein